MARTRRAARRRRSRRRVRPAPHRLALEPLPALAARGPRARWCGAGAGTAQAGARRLLVPGAGRLVCERGPLSEGRCAPSGPLWLRRSGPRKACGPQLCRPLPQGSARCRASSKTRSPYEAVNAAIACVSARPAERPRQLAGLPAPALPGCQPLLGIMGALPPNPRAPQSLAGRRGWGGVRTPLRRGPRQARGPGLPRVAG